MATRVLQSRRGRRCGCRLMAAFVAVFGSTLAFGQGISTITAGSIPPDEVVGVQIGAGTTAETTTGASGGESRDYAADGDAPDFACFNLDDPASKERCYQAVIEAGDAD